MTAFMWVIMYYALQAVGVIILILLGVFIFDKRFKKNQGDKVPDGFEKTEEVNIDPVTNVKTRVYYNPKTGDRFYKEEKN